MVEISPEELQACLLKKTRELPEIDIDDLLDSVAKENEVSLQSVAVELWDSLQWGKLELTRSHVTEGRVPPKDKRTKGPKSENLKSRRSARAYTEDLEQSIRREEGRIDRDRILQSWAFRRLEGVTQVVTPDQSGHLMHSRLTHSLKVGQVGRRIADVILSRRRGED